MERRPKSQVYLRSPFSQDQLVIQSIYLQCGVRLDPKTFGVIYKLCDLGIPASSIVELLQDVAKYSDKK